METYPSACVAAVSTVNWSLFRAHCSWWLPTVSAVVSALCAETEQRAEGVDAINESVYTPALDPMCCAEPVGTHVWPSCAYMLMRKSREPCCTSTRRSNHSKQKETQMGATGSDCSSGYNCFTLRLIVQGIPASVIKELPLEFAMVYSMLARMQ